jgi:hypothetical protein
VYLFFVGSIYAIPFDKRGERAIFHAFSKKKTFEIATRCPKCALSLLLKEIQGDFFHIEVQRGNLPPFMRSIPFPTRLFRLFIFFLTASFQKSNFFHSIPYDKRDREQFAVRKTKKRRKKRG